jgi:cold shock CspA family protein
MVQRDEGLLFHPAGRRWRQGVFVHVSAGEKASLDELREGDKVTFDIAASRGKESAENLKVK